MRYNSFEGNEKMMYLDENNELLGKLFLGNEKGRSLMKVVSPTDEALFNGW